MVKLCGCCLVCVESKEHKCAENTLKFDDIKKENNLDDNIVGINVTVCYHSDKKILEIETVFKGWYIGRACGYNDYYETFTVTNYPYMLEKGYYILRYNNIETLHLICDQPRWKSTSFDELVDTIKIGSLITLSCSINNLSDFFKLISDRFWVLKKIRTQDQYQENYVVAQEELVTKVALK